MQRTRMLQFIIGGMAATAVGVVCVATLRSINSNSRSVVGAPIEGAHVQNLRHVRYANGSRVLQVVVGDGVVRRPKIGPFRLGIARELVAHNVSIEIALGEKGADSLDAATMDAAISEVLPSSGARDGEIVSVSVQDVKIRLVGNGNRTMELAADTLNGGLTTGGRIAFRGNVVVVSGDERASFTKLDFDPRSRAFVAAALRPGENERENSSASRGALQTLNGWLAQIVPAKVADSADIGNS